jgi:DNA-directed RNA polymerase subunit L
VDNHIDGTAQPAVNYVAYKVPHPLRPEMFIRIGVQTDEDKDVEAQKNIARNTIATAARTLKEHFRGLLESWKALHVPK